LQNSPEYIDLHYSMSAGSFVSHSLIVLPYKSSRMKHHVDDALHPNISRQGQGQVEIENLIRLFDYVGFL
jgi:hypothetical protein